MRATLAKFWADLVESFWLVPAVMALLALILALALMTLDRALNLNLGRSLWVWSGDADGARSLLSTIASSMITVAGTVFSITIAALTLASQQFGPRLLRNFTSDRGNQIVLGTFVATFLYCLMVLRTVRSHDEGQFVPNIAVSFGVVLACGSIGVLIYYIHHVASSIQAESLLSGVGRDLRADLERLLPPSPPGPGVSPPEMDRPPSAPPVAISSAESGYIELIDRDGLFTLAEQRDLLIEIVHQPGDFVSSGEHLFSVWAEDQAVSDDLASALRGGVKFGPRRTKLQDVRYGIRQLTEIGARALSPGINDPFTAMGCVEWLVDSLGQTATREPPTGLRRSEDGAPRFREHPVNFPDLLRLSLDPIRTYGASSRLVVVRILECLARLAPRVTRPQHCRAILEEAQLTLRAAQAGLTTEHDLAAAAQAYAAVRKALTSATVCSSGEILPPNGVPAEGIGGQDEQASIDHRSRDRLPSR